MRIANATLDYATQPNTYLVLVLLRTKNETIGKNISTKRYKADVIIHRESGGIRDWVSYGD
ncbi:hypothetical protein [uncultured Psychroserpens sp.]|uniref:hypothetical protein n=1 Tax=uncultured Psychroserpens sp. TaxID=255436 RepID=UPI00260C3632|nr:hypothetical protein [uncultured Psychroserpens sp.]